MARTDATLVKGVISVDDNEVPDLDPFINAANELVTEVCAAYYEDSRLLLIETWLAAHFYAIRDNRVDSEKADVVSTKAQYKLGLNLASTMHGQQVMILDTQGYLAAISKQAEDGTRRGGVRALWLGSE